MEFDLEYVVLDDYVATKLNKLFTIGNIQKECGIMLFNFYRRKKTKYSYYDTWLYAVKDQKKLMYAAMKYNLTFYKTFNKSQVSN